MKPRLKLVESEHYGFYMWIVTHGEIWYHGELVRAGRWFSIPKWRFWEEGFK